MNYRKKTFELLKCQRGASAPVLIGIVMILAMVPPYLMATNEKSINNGLVSHRLNKAQQEARYFAGALASALPGSHSCTMNLLDQGLLNVPYASLNNQNFNPKLVADLGVASASNGQVTSTHIIGSLEGLLLKDLEVDSSRLIQCGTLDTDCIAPASPYSRVMKWQIRFKPKSSSSSRPIVQNLLMLIGLDGGGNAIGCRLTSMQENKIQEDRICQLLDASDINVAGPTYRMVPNSEGLLVRETCI